MIELLNRINSVADELRRNLTNHDPIDPEKLNLLVDLRRQRDELLAQMPEAERAAIVGNGNGTAGTNGDALPPELSEDSLALEFSARYAVDWRYVAAWGDWLKWDNQRWKSEKTLHAFDLIRRICRQKAEDCRKEKKRVSSKAYSGSTVAAIERLARSDRRHASTTDIWDLDPWLLNTPGGVVNLKTGETKPAERHFYMTRMTAGDASSAGRPSRWLSFLDEVTRGDAELAAYLARVAGYSLTGSTDEHALFFFYGTGANGKSVFLNTLAAVLGDYAANAPMDTFMETRTDRHPTDLASLRGARAVIAMEVENGRRWAESKIKALVGGDKISARFMRQDFFEYRPQFKLLIAGNHKPGLRDVDEAMRRRLHLIPFTVTIPREKRDKNLSARLLEEKDFILQWMIAGCVEWQARGLMPPPAVQAATEEYFEAEDSLQRWMDESCTTEPNDTALTANLFESWKIWAERAGEYVVPLKRFSESLSQRGFNRWRDPTNDRYGFRGIGLKNAF